MVEMKKLKPEELLLTLTDREKDVLLLICQHKSYQEIAEAFFLTKGTIRTHMFNIYAKLELDHLDRDERVLKIHNTFCPLLQKQSDQQQTQPEFEMIEETPNPEPVSPDNEEVVEESPDSTSLEEERVSEEPPDKKTISQDEEQVTEKTPDPEPISPDQEGVDAESPDPTSLEEEQVAEETSDPEPISTEDEQVTEETPDPEPISSEDEKMIDEDEMALVTYQPEPNTGGRKLMEIKKKRGCTRFIMTLILGALIVIGAWYAWQNFLQDIPIVQSIVPKSISNAGAYEYREWAKQDDVWVRVSEYWVTHDRVAVDIEVWNKTGHEYFFSWEPSSSFSMVDNQNNKYDVSGSYTRKVNLDTDEKDIIWGRTIATVDFDNDSIYKTGVTDLYITMEYFATIEKAVFHIDLTN